MSNPHPSKADKIWLHSLLRRNGLSITDISIERLALYAGLLCSWNHTVNLVSRRSAHDIWHTHILLSLAVLFTVHFRGGARVLDLGTGGGLPGIPLAIVCPDVAFTLVDAVRKKTVAVDDMVRRLCLKNVTVRCARAEILAKESWERNSYDAVIARAVDKLSRLVAVAAPLIRGTDREKIGLVEKTGELNLLPCLIAMKGGGSECESAVANKWSGTIASRVIPVRFAGDEQLENRDQMIVVVEYGRKE